MSAYIDEVLSHIKNKKSQMHIEAELNDHYCEKVKRYTDMGYSQEQAEEKADASFGKNGEIVGSELYLLEKRPWFCGALLALIAILLCAVYFICLLAEGGLSWMQTLVGASVYLCICVLIYFGLKRKRVYYIILAIADFLGMYMLPFILSSMGGFDFLTYRGGVIGFLNIMLNILTFNFEHIAKQLTFFNVEYKFWLFFASAELIVCFVGLIIYSLISVIKFNRIENVPVRLKEIKLFRKIFSGISLSMAVLIAFSLSICFFSPAVNIYRLEGVYIFETNEKTANCKIVSQREITKHYDLSEDFFESSSVYNVKENYTYRDCDIFCECLTGELYAEIASDCKYIYILPYGREREPYYDLGVWLDTDTSDIVSTSNFIGDYSVIWKVTIRVIEKQINDGLPYSVKIKK